MKRLQTILGLLLLASGHLLVGSCGSGSSGFDPVAAEQRAIERASQEGGCAQADETIICASGARLARTEAPDLPGEEATLTIDPASGSSASCQREDPGGGCSIRVAIVPQGFAGDSVFFAAARSQEPPSAWRLAASPFAASSQDPQLYEALVAVTSGSSEDAGKLQVAVLFYPPGSALPTPGAVESVLGSFGSSVAFVVTDVTLTQ